MGNILNINYKIIKKNYYRNKKNYFKNKVQLYKIIKKIHIKKHDYFF
jgi:hypothetical protein